MHLMCEEFVKGTTQVVHPEVAKVGPSLLMLKSQGAKTEAVWLLNKNWESVENQDDAWIKAIIDVHYINEGVLYLKDYKSGQMYDDHKEQLELYGLIGMSKFPEVKRVEHSALYLDMNYEGHQGSIIRPMVNTMVKVWDTNARNMMEDEVFEPKPGNQCRWCPYSKVNNNGVCLHG